MHNTQKDRVAQTHGRVTHLRACTQTKYKMNMKHKQAIMHKTKTRHRIKTLISFVSIIVVLHVTPSTLMTVVDRRIHLPYVLHAVTDTACAKY